MSFDFELNKRKKRLCFSTKKLKIANKWRNSLIRQQCHPFTQAFPVFSQKKEALPRKVNPRYSSRKRIIRKANWRIVFLTFSINSSFSISMTSPKTNPMALELTQQKTMIIKLHKMALLWRAVVRLMTVK